LFSSTVFVEGWALYCEEQYRQRDYYPDKKTELIQLKDQLWRACRVVIDSALHTGRMSTDGATEMLVDIAGLEKINARAEANRYSQTPTQPMSYLIGKIRLEELSREYRTHHPNRSDRQFHDDLLSFGSIPFDLLNTALRGNK
jgi:uncharacterized protein (DUF885 family)